MLRRVVNNRLKLVLVSTASNRLLPLEASVQRRVACHFPSLNICAGEISVDDNEIAASVSIILSHLDLLHFFGLADRAVAGLHMDVRLPAGVSLADVVLAAGATRIPLTLCA